MFRRGLLLLLPALLLFGFFVTSRAESAPPPATFPAIIAVQHSANLRAGPGIDYAITGSATAGQLFFATGCNADCSWYQLGADCWIAAFLVAPYLPLSPVAPTVNVQIPISVTGTLTPVLQLVIVEATPLPPGVVVQCPQTREQVNTYAGPSSLYPVVDSRPAGECVSVIGRNLLGNWFQLFKGMWVAADMILFAEPIIYMPITEFTATPTPTPMPTNTLAPEAQPSTATPSSAQSVDNSTGDGST